MHRLSNKLASIIFTISLFFFIITFSISLPIYCRPFYYAHINAMELSQSTGFSESEIRKTYDEVLDYLTLPGKNFSTGVMKHSSEGASHFADCKRLFDLNAYVLISSIATMIFLSILKCKNVVSEFKIKSHKPCFWASITALCFPVILGLLISIDFDYSFTVFHKLFFPGKDNWIFNPSTDEIINILPQEFFMNCAIFIGISIIILSLSGIIYDLIKRRQ